MAGENQEQNAQERHKVLVAEADRLTAGILRAKLTAWGYDVHVEDNGSTAVHTFKLEPCRIAIVGMDLPGLSGPEVCRTLRNMPRAGYTYIICIGESADKEGVLAALEAGANDFMQKPLHVHQLRLRLKNAERLIMLDDALFKGGGTDPITGRVNRGAFEQFLRVVLAQAKRTHSKGALMFVRITNYQEILDKFGFDAAHEAVVAISGQLTGVHRDSDLLAKTRPEEFCLLLQNTHWDECRPVAERIATRTAGIAIQVGAVKIRPIVVVETVNYPQRDVTALDLLDKVSRIPFEGTPGEGATIVEGGRKRGAII